ncbi:hypothetical protein ECAE60S_02696 [Eoetvoesiella caeni]
MYSYEDRLRAVMLYLKLGRRINATLRQLGYSNKNSFKAWCAELEKSLAKFKIPRVVRVLSKRSTNIAR